MPHRYAVGPTIKVYGASCLPAFLRGVCDKRPNVHGYAMRAIGDAERLRSTWVTRANVRRATGSAVSSLMKAEQKPTTSLARKRSGRPRATVRTPVTVRLATSRQLPYPVHHAPASHVPRANPYTRLGRDERTHLNEIGNGVTLMKATSGSLQTTMVGTKALNPDNEASWFRGNA